MVTPDHNTTDMYSHEHQCEPSAILPAMEAMPPASPSKSMVPQGFSETLDTHGHAGNPDSTSDIQTANIPPYTDMEENNDAQTEIQNAIDQTQEEVVDSSLYRNISMWVEDKNIVIEGSRM